MSYEKNKCAGHKGEAQKQPMPRAASLREFKALMKEKTPVFFEHWSEVQRDTAMREAEKGNLQYGTAYVETDFPARHPLAGYDGELTANQPRRQRRSGSSSSHSP